MVSGQIRLLILVKQVKAKKISGDLCFNFSVLTFLLKFLLLGNGGFYGVNEKES